jgi:hypothetical protein
MNNSDSWLKVYIYNPDSWLKVYNIFTIYYIRNPTYGSINVTVTAYTLIIIVDTSFDLNYTVDRNQMFPEYFLCNIALFLLIDI